LAEPTAKLSIKNVIYIVGAGADECVELVLQQFPPTKPKSRLPQGENKRASKSLLRARRIYMAPKPNGTRYADLQKPPPHPYCEQAPTFRLASELSP
jgi:hypothetical protein